MKLYKILLFLLTSASLGASVIVSCSLVKDGIEMVNGEW